MPAAHRWQLQNGCEFDSSDIRFADPQLHLNQKEVIHTLQQHSKIEPSFTALVWQKLEEQNPEFFKCAGAVRASTCLASWLRLLNPAACAGYTTRDYALRIR